MATAADVLCVMLAVFFTEEKPKQERNKDRGLSSTCHEEGNMGCLTFVPIFFFF